MTYINWGKPFEYEVGNETFSFPTYGNYGGAGYSTGKFGQNPPISQSGSYLSDGELADNKDALDYRFYKHDVASFFADTPAEQRAADLKLIRGIDNLSNAQLSDPEASFYAGLATIAIGGQALANNPSSAFANKFLPYLDDALDNIEGGLSGLSQTERAKAVSVLEETVDALQDINFPGSAVDRIVDALGFQVDVFL
jgi:hypothetical protein